MRTGVGSSTLARLKDELGTMDDLSANTDLAWEILDQVRTGIP